MARLHDIKEVDVVNTFWGVATSLWFNHCPHRCFNCWNEETWELDESLEQPNDQVIEMVFQYLDSYGVAKSLTILGGEPFSPYNVEDLYQIVTAIKAVRPHTKVLAWSGYEYSTLNRHPKMKRILPYLDVLVCGRYCDEWNCHEKNKLYGSENQYVVDVQQSLQAGEIIYIEKGQMFQEVEEARQKREGKSTHAKTIL